MQPTIRFRYTCLSLGLSLLCLGAWSFHDARPALGQDTTGPIAEPPEEEVGAANNTILGVDQDQEPGDHQPQIDRRNGLSWRSQDDQLVVDDNIDGTVWSNAGLRANDSILMINGRPVRTDAQVDDALREAQMTSGNVDVTYSRSGIRNRVSVNPWSEQTTQDLQNADPVPNQDSTPSSNGNANRDDPQVPVPDGIRSINAIGMNESGGQLRINQVSSNSAWAQAGLQGGDVIVLANDQRVKSRAQLQSVVNAAQRNNEQLQVTVLRDGQLKDVSIVFNDASNRQTLNRYDTYYRGAAPANRPAPTMTRSYYTPYRAAPQSRYPYAGYSPYSYGGYRNSYLAPSSRYYYGGWNSGCYRRGLFRGGLFRRY